MRSWNEGGSCERRTPDQYATGQDRMQVIDSNWAVVGQSPDPGAPIGEGDAVLSVVKYGEPGSC